MIDLSAFRDLPLDHPLPVETWNPPSCGEMDLRIARDGVWYHEGRPILRPDLVRLFSRILRKDGDRYLLVTPAEKVVITVEDVPFIAVDMIAGPDALAFRTDVGDVVTADSEHPLRFVDADGAFIPYVMVRRGLEARLSRAVTQALVGQAEVSGDQFGVRSAGCFFAMAAANTLF